MTPENARWYVASIKPHISWETIIFHLDRQHFGHYLPTVIHKSYQNGALVTTETLLFSPYIFVSFDTETHTTWRSIKNTIGIYHVLPVGAEIPTPIATEIVDDLRIADRTITDAAAIIKRFSKHEIVRVLEGPLKNQMGRVLSSTGKSTTILSEAFARKVMTTVPTENLIEVL